PLRGLGFALHRPRRDAAEDRRRLRGGAQRRGFAPSPGQLPLPLLPPGAAGADKQFVEQKLRSALWLIKSVEQRQRTIRKVATSLVKFQRDFFDRGLAPLRPLALR